jgi:hypothetical protein
VLVPLWPDRVANVLRDMAPVLYPTRLEVRVRGVEEHLGVLSRERADRAGVRGVIRCSPDRRLLARPREVAGRLTGKRGTGRDGRYDSCAESAAKSNDVLLITSPPRLMNADARMAAATV